MRLSHDQLENGFGRTLSSGWLVAGDEPLFVGEATDAIRARARSEGYSGREVLFVERGFDWNEFTAGLRAMSLFAERRIVEVRLATPKPGAEGARALTAALADPSPDVLLLVVTDKIEYADRSSAWVKTFEQQGVFVEAEQLAPERLPAWVTARMRRAGLAPTPEAALLLAERCEGNLVAAHQEIELLRLLLGEAAVDVDTVAEAVAHSARYHVFQLGEAMLTGDAGRVVRILDGLEAEGEGLPLVVWCVTEELRAVLQWPGPSQGAPPRLWRGGQRRKEQLARAARRVPRPLAISLLSDAARADRLAKSGGKASAWGTVARIATQFCIAAQNRAG